MKIKIIKIIIVALLVLLINTNYIENFSSTLNYNYLNNVVNRNVVSLKPELVNPYIFGYNSYDIVNYIFLKQLTNLIPFNITKQKNSQNIIKNIKNNNINFGCILESEYFNDIYIKKNEDITYICGLNYKYFTLIIPQYSKINSWNELKNKIVATDSKLSDSNYILEKINSYFNLNIKIINSNVTNILEKIKNKNVDAIFHFIEQPHPIIINYSKHNKIKIIDNSELKEDIIKLLFPTIIIKKIDITSYKLQNITKTINIYGIKKIIISNKMVNINYVYNFIKTIIDNILLIKRNIYFHNINSNDILFTPYKFNLHRGIIKFMIERNYITYESNKECIHLYSKVMCNKEILNNNHLSIQNN